MIHTAEQLRQKCHAIDMMLRDLVDLVQHDGNSILIRSKVENLYAAWRELDHEVHIEKLIAAARNSGC